MDLRQSRTKSPLICLMMAVVYLCYPMMQWNNALEFHPDSFATPFLLGALYYLDSKRSVFYFGFLVLALLCKETVGLSILTLGVVLILLNKRQRGIQTIVLGIVGLIVALGTVRWYNAGHPSAYFGLYAQWGIGLTGVLRGMLSHPMNVAQTFTSSTSQTYFTSLLLPLAFLPFLTPKWIIPALPALFTNLFNSRSFGMTQVFMDNMQC